MADLFLPEALRVAGRFGEMMEIQPNDIDTGPLVLPGTFGRAEREAAAWMIVRLYQVRGWAWDHTFVLRDLAALIDEDEATRRRCSNPFFRPDFRWREDNEFIVPSNPDDVQQPIRLAPSFVERVTRQARMRLLPPGPYDPGTTFARPDLPAEPAIVESRTGDTVRALCLDGQIRTYRVQRGTIVRVGGDRV